MEGSFNILKNLQNVINKALVNFKKSPKDRLTLEYIETKQKMLEKDWTLFKDINNKLYEKLSVEEIEEEVGSIYDSTEDVYITYHSLMQSLINKIKEQKKSENNNDKSLSSHSSSSSALVKLPKISIPIFSGKYSEWTTFHDLFTSLVHKNNSLDNVQKLHYLKSHLTGEADQLIRHTPITDANYSQCWALLEKRYSNKKYLCNCILQRLFAQKRIFVESATSLKDLIDVTCDCLNALKNLDIDVTTWDVIIIHIVTSKLDTETRKQWELTVTNNDSSIELPTFEQFKDFIEKRFRALEYVEPKKSVNSFHQVNNSSTAHKPKALLAISSSNLRCEYCSETHKLCFCKTFAKQPIDKRRDFVAKNRICFNCLGSNHTVYDCRKITSCRLCKRRHHSLLHPDLSGNVDQNRTPKPDIDSANSANSTDQIVSCLSTGHNVKSSRQVLLATALIKAESKTGRYMTVRALLDQGSQACFVTESTTQFLGLKKLPVRGTISGVGNDKSINVKYTVQLTIRSCLEQNFEMQIKAYVLPKITGYLPERSFTNDDLNWIGINCTLADPDFNKPNKIDILLGADAYSNIIHEGMTKDPSGNLIAQNTCFGWVLSGTIGPRNGDRTTHISAMHTYLREDEMLKAFWEIEEQISTKKMLTPEEKRCEDFYSSTTKRDDDGRYVVRLPFRDEEPPCKAGNSRTIAEKRFNALEKRLAKDKELKGKYTAVIEEYLELGHMRKVKDDERKDEAVYLPHHAVIRDDKTTTKVRVVFNASEKNSKGVSLNDTLMIGPTLQADLRHTVLRWRTYPIGLVADIIKMYRQVKIADDDAMFQRILWRANPDEELKDYELVTVTFGTASAPYTAVRTLHELAYDEGHNFPLASDRVLNCFYMDDLMTGSENIESGLEIYKQLNQLLLKGGFQLQKWNTNNKDLLEHITSIEKGNLEQIKYTYNNDNKDEKLTIKLNDTIKILGLTWNRSEDTFQYSVNLPDLKSQPVTKRSILSDIARLFDPLGWLAPSVVLAKIFIQQLWLAGIGWDEKPHVDLINQWISYRSELVLLTQIRIPRWLGTKSHDDRELHGFSDASKAAYSAVIYMRIIDPEGNVQVSLVVAKTRVAPIKQVSIPRLELCGAVLLSKLLIETADVLNIPKTKIRAWTDSTVVLAWLNSHPSRWKTFVGNRTSEILTNLDSSQWFHVSTKHNPADCASRGMRPSELITNTLWFEGPSFLKENTLNYNRLNDNSTNLEEIVKAHIIAVPECSLFERFSSLNRLLRVIAYCRRFLKKNKQGSKNYLQKIELSEALTCCIKKSQRDIFTVEYTQLKEKGYLQSKPSRLRSLCPYLDDHDIIRVSGRLQKAELEEQTKHPIVLSSSCRFVKLLVADAHIKTLHGGPQLMANYLRNNYWILGVRNLVKSHVHQCVTCVRQKAITKPQFMGSLPTVRCTPARPFLHSGVDYAGPIFIRTTKGRGHRSYKGYICVFVCMSTRAIHLEFVSDMSTEAFLAAFRRFVARRGHCAKIWSNNGTTFQGASQKLRELTDLQSTFAEQLEANGTEWHFIPPHSPNFGGIWEAAVKSTKYHLKRVIGDSTLTFEEMSTLLSQIEACLNSRPMSVMNVNDPGEPLPLTPGHFLIGETLINTPSGNYENSNVVSLTRWQLTQRMLQSFWRRWSQEYLSNLMNRYKWTSRVPEPTIGDIVLIKEDNLPPSRWLLGRVEQKHPGNDNITRVVTLRTKSSTIKRPTSKLCILPVTDT